jgi:hypothetical protein
LQRKWSCAKALKRIVRRQKGDPRTGILAVAPQSPVNPGISLGATPDLSTLLPLDILVVEILRQYRKGRLCCGKSVC